MIEESHVEKTKENSVASQNLTNQNIEHSEQLIELKKKLVSVFKIF